VIAVPESESEERELRALLERGVPQLPAPAQRLESVRIRIRRRRRRRAAGLSGAAVLAVVLAGLLVPGTGGSAGVPAPGVPSTALAGPASAGPRPAPTPTSTPPPTSTDDAAVDLRQFAKLGGLTLRLPRTWSVLAPGGSSTVWVSSQALALPAGGCDKALDDFCTPLQRSLEPGGVLVQFAFDLAQGKADKARARAPQVGNEAVYTACRTIGGTAQLATQLTDQAGSAVFVLATACLSHPGPAQEAQVRDVLTTADFT
jgi:hypothetical protein